MLSRCLIWLWDVTDCSPPGSSVHGILQARVLEWVAVSYSRDASWPRDWTCTSCTGRRVLYRCASRPSGREQTQAPQTEGPGFVPQLDNHDRAVMRMLCNPRKLKLPHVNFLKNNYSYFSWLWELNKKKRWQALVHVQCTFSKWEFDPPFLCSTSLLEDLLKPIFHSISYYSTIQNGYCFHLSRFKFFFELYNWTNIPF